MRSNPSSIRSHIRHSWSLGAVLCFALTAQALSIRLAHAQEAAAPASEAVASKSPEIADARRKAIVALNTGHYQEAIKALEEAYALDQDPSLLFSLAQAYRLSGQPTKALEACSSYLRSAGPSKTDRLQAELFLAEVTMIAYQIQLQRQLGAPTPPATTADAHREDKVELTAPQSEVEPPSFSQDKARSTGHDGKIDLTPRPTPQQTALVEVSNAPEPAPRHYYESPKFWLVVGAVAVVAGAGLGYWAWERSQGLKSPNTALGYQTAFP